MPIARSLADHIADLVAVVGDGPAVVVGHSYGGAVALGAAVQAPEVIGAVGAYEPPMPWTPWWPRRSASSIADEDPATFAEGFFRRVVGDAGWDRLSDRPAPIATPMDPPSWPSSPICVGRSPPST